MKATSPTPCEICRAVETLQAAGAVFALPAGSRVQVLSIADAAEALSVSRDWVRDHLDEFPAASQLPGGLIRIPIRDVDSLLDRTRMSQAPRFCGLKEVAA
jgi:hypothetical protein